MVHKETAMFKLPLMSTNLRSGMLRFGKPALKSLALVAVAGLALGGCTVMPQGPVEGYPATYPNAGYPASAPVYPGSPAYGSGYYGNGGYYGGSPSVGHYPPAVYVTPRVVTPAPIIVTPRAGYATPRPGYAAPAIVPPRVVSPGAPAYAARPSQPAGQPAPGYNPRNQSAPSAGYSGGGHSGAGHSGGGYSGGGYRASPGASLPASRSGHQSDRRH